MKRYYLIFLLIGTLSSGFAAVSKDFPSGTFVNPQLGYQLDVLPTNLGLRVRGVPGERGWRVFRFTGRNRYFDRRGNELVFANPRRLSLRTNRHHRPIVFVLSRMPGQTLYYRHSNDRNRNHSECGQCNGSCNHDNSRRWDMSGRWYGEDYSQPWYLEQSADGIRIRTGDLREWNYYRRIDNHTFRDKHGNQCAFYDQDLLEWSDYRGRKRHFLRRNW